MKRQNRQFTKFISLLFQDYSTQIRQCESQPSAQRALGCDSIQFTGLILVLAYDSIPQA